MPEIFVIAQGGGPTAVINQTMAGAVLEARRRFPGCTVLGARHGVRGIRKGDFVDFAALAEADLMRIADTPGAALGSTRDKPDAAYCNEILAGLRRVKATGFVYIGGNDTAGTQAILSAAAVLGENAGNVVLQPLDRKRDLGRINQVRRFGGVALPASGGGGQKACMPSHDDADIDARQRPKIQIDAGEGRGNE